MLISGLFEFLRDKVAPGMPEPQQVPDVLLSSILLILRKLIIDHISSTNHRLLRLVPINTLIQSLLLVHHPMIVILKHHSLLVVKLALHHAPDFIHSPQVSRHIQILVKLLTRHIHIFLSFLICTAFTQPQLHCLNDIKVWEFRLVEQIGTQVHKQTLLC